MDFCTSSKFLSSNSYAVRINAIQASASKFFPNTFLIDGLQNFLPSKLLAIH